MQRLPEPELMTESGQVRAYADADFAVGDDRTLALIENLLSAGQACPGPKRIVDLGCGPGNITLRLAQRFPDARVIGVDGSPAMLSLAQSRAQAMGLTVAFRCSTLQELELEPVDLVVSNSLLHHLHDPVLLWQVTRRLAVSGCRVLHRDLRRPASLLEVHRLQHVNRRWTQQPQPEGGWAEHRR